MSEKKGKKKRTVVMIDKNLDKSLFLVIFSQFIVAEISNHLADWFLLQKVIKSGFSYREFSKERKNYNLSQTERDKIDYIIEDISEKSFVNTIPIKDITINDLELLFELMNNQVELFDALHIIWKPG